MTALARAHLRDTTHRLIASRYPAIGVFDDLTTDREEVAMACLLESVTNDRLAILSRRLPLIPSEEIVQGPGATLVMAAFLHAGDSGGRFTDRRLGAWYASLDVDTAIAETVHHSTRRLRLSQGGFPSNIQMRQLVATVDCKLVDIRGGRRTRSELYDADDHSAGQAFGVGLRWPPTGTEENGIVCDSVRRKDGTNVCIYRPSLIELPVIQADHYEYRWDAEGDVTVLKLTSVASESSTR